MVNIQTPATQAWRRGVVWHDALLLMNDAVLQLSLLSRVPSIGGADQVASDSLKEVEVLASALRARLQSLLRSLVTAVKAAYTVVVDTSVAHIVLVHKVDDFHNSLGVMRRVAVHLHVEDMTPAREDVIRGLDLGLLLRRAVVVHGNVVGVGVVLLVGHAGNDTVLLLVDLRELTGQALGGSRQDGVVMLVLVTVFVDLLVHVGDDPQAELLGLLALAVVLAHERDKTLRQADETDAKRALVKDTPHGIRRLQLLAADPHSGHQHWELLGYRRRLELEALMKLQGRDIKQPVELFEEGVDALTLVLDAHTLDGEAGEVQRREAQVPASDGGLRAEAILEHTRAAAHRGYLVDKAFRVVCAPVRILVVRRVEIEVVRKEPTGRHLTREAVKVVVRVAGQV